MSDGIYSGDSELLIQFLRFRNGFIIYHTLLKKFPGGCNVKDMSIETGLTRNRVYKALDIMCETGLAKVKKVRKKQNSPIISNVYTHILQNDPQIMGIIERNDDPNKAYVGIDSIWKDILESVNS